MVRLAFVLPLLIMSACGGDAPLIECPGERPPIEQCYRGAFFAECGGQGDQRFACNEAGDCRWFTTSCVAAGYEASACGPYELCCEEDWPYPAGALSSAAASQLSQDIYGWGRLPWDRVRLMRLQVEVDPGLMPTTPGVTCTGTYPAEGTPCGVQNV